jgi:hypothetical protein
VESLRTFLPLWFGEHVDHDANPATTVGRLLTFNQLAPEGRVDEDVDVLVVENQGVWLWGRTRDGRHVERENEPGIPWEDTGESTEEFWLHHAAFEAVTNLPASRSAQELDVASVARIKDAVRPLPCGSWAWPGLGHTLFHRGSSVVMICADGADSWVVASAPTEGGLEWLDDLDLTWDESDTRREPRT